jgi:hypothetical protein
VTSRPAVFLNPDADEAYYLAFDFLLARAPVRDAVIFGRESHTVVDDPDDFSDQAWHATIKATLLRASLGDSPAWQKMIDAEFERARSLWERVGVDAPPELRSSDVLHIHIGPETPIE